MQIGKFNPAILGKTRKMAKKKTFESFWFPIGVGVVYTNYQTINQRFGRCMALFRPRPGTILNSSIK